MAKKGRQKASAVELQDLHEESQGEEDGFYEEPLAKEPTAETGAGGSNALEALQDEPSEESVPREPAVEKPKGGDYQSQRPQVLIDGEIFFRREGDLLLDIDEDELYEQQQTAQQALREAARYVEQAGFGEAQISDSGLETGALIGMVEDGKFVRWPPGAVLRYCVLEHTFPRREWYEVVVENMQLATSEWEETCGVQFEYRSDLDGSDSLRPPGVVFPVRLINAGGAFIAAAFFPRDVDNRRRVLIDPSYFTTRFDQVGVLRHELGHVLGFRHEHTSEDAPTICPDEDLTGTLDLTAYDPKSVMHYFCGGVGSLDLAITDVDRTGSQLVYGPPLSRFALVAV